nr:alpha-amylase family glycosyl hydrolase [Weissella cibaria]
MYYFLPGVPFIYQGQELGMKNFERRHISKFNDVSSLNDY